MSKFKDVYKEFIRATLIRAIRTFAEGCLSYGIVAGVKLSEIDWIGSLSAGAVAAIVSILMAISTGLPEAPVENENDGQDDPDL